MDLTNRKTVLAFLFVCRITVDLKSTPSASPNTKASLQMEIKTEIRLQHEKKKRKKRKRMLIQEADNFLRL